MLNHLTLQMRLTVLTGLIVIATALCLTIISNINADTNLMRAFENQQLATATEPSLVIQEVRPAPTIGPSPIPASSVTAATMTVAYKQFAYANVFAMIIIIIVSMAVTFLTAGKVLKPVRELSHLVKNISDQNLFQRIEGFTNKDEISQLANSFNLMIQRLDTSFSSQKQFVSNASHELKTPLTIIKSGIQVLKLDENPTQEDYQEVIEVTEQSINRLILVVEGLLALTTEQLEAFSEPVALELVMADIIEEMKPLIVAKELKLIIRIEEASIVGNTLLIYRALFNVIENAVKYNKVAGEVKLEIIHQAGGVTVRISDSGIGIEEEELTRIFEPFYRVDPSRSREIGGSGLGLAIVKTIVEKHHGQLNVKSQIGVGSIFEMVFPNQ